MKATVNSMEEALESLSAVEKINDLADISRGNVSEIEGIIGRFKM